MSRAREIYYTHTHTQRALHLIARRGNNINTRRWCAVLDKKRESHHSFFFLAPAGAFCTSKVFSLCLPAGRGKQLETRQNERFLSLSYSLSSPLANALADSETFLSLVPLSCFRAPTRNVNNNKQVISEKEQKSSSTNGLFSKLFSSNKNIKRRV